MTPLLVLSILLFLKTMTPLLPANRTLHNGRFGRSNRSNLVADTPRSVEAHAPPNVTLKSVTQVLLTYRMVIGSFVPLEIVIIVPMFICVVLVPIPLTKVPVSPNATRRPPYP